MRRQQHTRNGQRTQHDIVLESLRGRGDAGLTPQEAFQFTPRITRLAAIVFTLRAQGYWIDTKEGTNGRTARYVLRDSRPFSESDRCKCTHTLSRHAGNHGQAGCIAAVPQPVQPWDQTKPQVSYAQYLVCPCRGFRR